MIVGTLVTFNASQRWLSVFLSRSTPVSYTHLAQKKINFFVFGHRHLAIDYRLNEDARYINLGDWMLYYTYAVFNGYTMELKSYKGKDEKIVRN